MQGPSLPSFLPGTFSPNNCTDDAHPPWLRRPQSVGSPQNPHHRRGFYKKGGKKGKVDQYEGEIESEKEEGGLRAGCHKLVYPGCRIYDTVGDKRMIKG